MGSTVAVEEKQTEEPQEEFDTMPVYHQLVSEDGWADPRTEPVER